MVTIYLACCLLAGAAADPPVHADRPNAVVFPAQDARFVRLVIHGSSSGEPCIDELEVYGPDGKANLALAGRGAKAAASSCLRGYAQHAIEHLNDGLYGNDHSWIAASAGTEWAQIELPAATKVSRVVFSRDRERQYADRVPIRFEVQLSLDGKQWTAVKKVAAGAAPVTLRRRAGGFSASIPDPPPPPRPDPGGAVVSAEQLRYAFLGEEHAWLKTYGRADISQRLVPYNGRVKEYPRYVGDDRLPLAPLSSPPQLDGNLDDACWAAASRGVVRVASPDAFDRGPLVTSSVTAGWHGDHLFLAITTDRLLSSHLAVISRADGEGCGVVAVTDKGLIFNTYDAERGDGAKLKQSTLLEGAMDRALGRFEFRLPLAAFADCKTQGLRVGLGMGGKHTAREGRPVWFDFSTLAVAEIEPCVNRTFQVRLAASAGGQAVNVKGSLPELADGLSLQPGESRVVSIPAERGAIGPQHTLKIDEASGNSCVLHLFRYDPLERTLGLMEEMLDRFAAKGMDVAKERKQADGLRKRQEALLAKEPQLAAQRQTLFEARVAKRQLLLRERELAPIGKILFVKRHAYEPSHNYSVLLDAPWRPGGGVCVLEIPGREGRFEPAEARLTELFSSGAGIARDAVASFDASRIYFGYRPSESGYFHLMSMAADGRDLKQLTDGPFHDFFPCPLPDGGLAFTSTRCRSRYLCWRPQAFVLFRMDAGGSDIAPLSYANLSEWAPSVTRDGRILWTRSEYIDKGADFSHTLWRIRPDGTQPELVFGNTIIQPNGYANGREVPGTAEVCCTLISHFGDLNGPIALVDTGKGRFNPKAIQSLTPEVPWPGMWPDEECFRDPQPIARDYFLVSHAPRRQFGLYLIDRFGNREVLYQDMSIGSFCPTPLHATAAPPVLAPLREGVGSLSHGGADVTEPLKPFGSDAEKTPDPLAPHTGQFVLADVYRGMEATVPRGTIKYLRVVEEVRAGLQQVSTGEYRKDHEPFMEFYAAPVDLVSGPYGWPCYVAKQPWGIVPVEEDGSANFYAPAGRQLYLQALDADLNEVQRMRSVVQLQPGETRSCIGCHEDRRQAPPARAGSALRREPSRLQAPPWGAGPLAYQQAVQPVWDRKCVECHNAGDKQKIDLTGALDANRIPASYRTLIQQGWVHVLDCGWNSGGNEKREPYSFGTFQSKLWKVLNPGHYGAELTRDEMHAVKCWIDMNCPLWPDYVERRLRPGPK